MRGDFLDAIASRVVIYDGAMAPRSSSSSSRLPTTADSLAAARGTRAAPSRRDRRDPRGMIEAGAEVIETCTFQGSRLKLGEWGLAEHTLEINTRAAQIARKAAGTKRFVAGSIVRPASCRPRMTRPSVRSRSVSSSRSSASRRRD